MSRDKAPHCNAVATPEAHFSAMLLSMQNDLCGESQLSSEGQVVENMSQLEPVLDAAMTERSRLPALSMT